VFSKDGNKQIWVKLDVECKDEVTADRADVFLRKELSLLEDVVVTDENPEFRIIVMIIKIENPYGYFVAYAVSAIHNYLDLFGTLGFSLLLDEEEYQLYGKIEKVISKIKKKLESNPQEKQKFYQENQIEEFYDLSLITGSNLQKICREIVRDINSSIFESIREIRRKKIRGRKIRKPSELLKEYPQ